MSVVCARRPPPLPPTGYGSFQPAPVAAHVAERRDIDETFTPKIAAKPERKSRPSPVLPTIKLGPHHGRRIDRRHASAIELMSGDTEGALANTGVGRITLAAGDAELIMLAAAVVELIADPLGDALIKVLTDELAVDDGDAVDVKDAVLVFVDVPDALAVGTVDVPTVAVAVAVPVIVRVAEAVEVSDCVVDADEVEEGDGTALPENDALEDDDAVDDAEKDGLALADELFEALPDADDVADPHAERVDVVVPDDVVDDVEVDERATERVEHADALFDRDIDEDPVPVGVLDGESDVRGDALKETVAVAAVE